MSRKAFFISLIALLIPLMVAGCFADPAAQIQQAEQYVEDESYEQAEKNYQGIIQQHGGTIWALEAQKELTIVYITWGKQPEAQAAYEKLLADFSGNEGIAEAVYRVADKYRRLKKYEKAREVYQYVVDNWPGSEEAMDAQARLAVLAISSIRLRDEGAAQEAIDKLLTEFSGNKRLLKWVYKIAKVYGGRGKYEKARELYQYVLDNWPGSEYAMRSQKGVAISNIRLGDEGAAQAAIEKFLTEFSEFSENKRFPQGVCEIADEYYDSRRYEKAREFYQYVLDNWPGSEKVMDAQAGLAISYFGLGDDPNAQAAFDKLIADFNDHPDLAKAVFRIGEQYYMDAFGYQNEGREDEFEDRFRAAVAVWDRGLTELPESDTTADILYFSGRCYESLGEYVEAIERFQRVTRDWPGYQHAATAQYLLARCYEKLASVGLISKQEAAPLICQACEKVLANYPASKAAKAARNLLEWWDAMNSQ